MELHLCATGDDRRRPATTGGDRRRPATTGDDRRRLKIMFGHIKYDEKYMPELFLTLPELQNKQNNEFLLISKKVAFWGEMKIFYHMLRIFQGSFST